MTERFTQQKMNKQSYHLIIAVSIFAILINTGCSPEPDKTDSGDAEISIQTALATYSEIPGSMTYSGSVQGAERIKLSTKITGRIEALHADIGDKVEKNELLVEIESEGIKAQKSQVEANLREAQAHLNNTRANFERITALYRDSSATRKELDDITTQLEVAESRVAALENKKREIDELLSYAVIRSPINGFVIGRQVYRGDLASPGQVLLTVEETDKLEIVVSVPESEIGNMDREDSVSVYVGAVKQQFGARVTAVNPSADRMSRQYEIKIDVPAGISDEGRVKSGMFASIRVPGQVDKHLAIPLSALIERGQLTGIFTVNDSNELVLRWIRTGEVVDSDITVLSGLADGERYVVEPSPALTEGQKITVN